MKIYAVCQKKLFSLEHDTGVRVLLVTFLAEHSTSLSKRLYPKLYLVCKFKNLFSFISVYGFAISFFFINFYI